MQINIPVLSKPNPASKFAISLTYIGQPVIQSFPPGTTHVFQDICRIVNNGLILTLPAMDMATVSKVALAREAYQGVSISCGSFPGLGSVGKVRSKANICTPCNQFRYQVLCLYFST
jgi:hypothetical protein